MYKGYNQVVYTTDMDQIRISRLYYHMSAISIKNSPVLIVIIEQAEGTIIDISVLADDDTEMYAYKFKDTLIHMINSDREISDVYVGIGKHSEMDKCLHESSKDKCTIKPLIWISPSSKL